MLACEAGLLNGVIWLEDNRIPRTGLKCDVYVSRSLGIRSVAELFHARGCWMSCGCD